MPEVSNAERALEQIHTAVLELREMHLSDEARQHIETIIACCESKAPADITVLQTVSIGGSPEVQSAYARLTIKG